MSKLAARVKRLEARPGGGRGPCRLCGDGGYMSLIDERRGQTRDDAKGCPSCGKISKLIVLGE